MASRAELCLVREEVRRHLGAGGEHRRVRDGVCDDEGLDVRQGAVRDVDGKSNDGEAASGEARVERDQVLEQGPNAAEVGRQGRRGGTGRDLERAEERDPHFVARAEEDRHVRVGERRAVGEVHRRGREVADARLVRDGQERQPARAVRGPRVVHLIAHASAKRLRVRKGGVAQSRPPRRAGPRGLDPLRRCRRR